MIGYQAITIPFRNYQPMEFQRRRATSLLVRLVEEEDRWEIPDHPQNWGGIETNRTVTCMMLKADENDRRKSSPLPSMNFVALDLMLISVTVDQNNYDVQELWFQQDGATCHTARATIDLLKDTFGDCLISRFGPVNWPPRSCDLTPLDYFLWGYVKSLVYVDKPQTLDHLEDNILRVVADIRPQM
ncbi:transposable element Tc3 transposase [Trichonephila clavipes]|nr:transposable element Tc3 transposase [Trichonephila clavipes]